MVGTIDTWAAMLAAQQSRRQEGTVFKALTGQDGRLMQNWVGVPDVGIAPTSAVAPTRATAGALLSGGEQLFNSGGSFKNFLVGAHLSTSPISALTNRNTPKLVLLCDRLSHQGGLSGTTTGAQTTNLPTAALTRYTSGLGVMMRLDIYAAVGSTPGVDVTASYTNQAGTSGQTSVATQLGATGYRELGRSIILPLASGDSGVQAVASVTITSTTGTAGNFGVTLFKPLAAFITTGGVEEQFHEPVLTGNMFGGLPEIVDDACLEWLTFSFYTTSTSDVVMGQLTIAEV